MSILFHLLIKINIIKEKTPKQKYDVLIKKTAKEYHTFLSYIHLAHTRSNHHHKLNCNEAFKEIFKRIPTINDLNEKFLVLEKTYNQIKAINKNPF